MNAKQLEKKRRQAEALERLAIDRAGEPEGEAAKAKAASHREKIAELEAASPPDTTDTMSVLRCWAKASGESHRTTAGAVRWFYEEKNSSDIPFRRPPYSSAPSAVEESYRQRSFNKASAHKVRDIFLESEEAQEYGLKLQIDIDVNRIRIEVTGGGADCYRIVGLLHTIERPEWHKLWDVVTRCEAIRYGIITSARSERFARQTTTRINSLPGCSKHGLKWQVQRLWDGTFRAQLVDAHIKQVLQQLADAGYWEIEFNAWLDNPLMVDSRAREVQRVLDWVAGHVAKLPALAPLK